MFVGAQDIEWDSFNERKMDTVMFNVMNSYFDYKDDSTFNNSNYIIWSPVVQKDLMSGNHNYIKVRSTNNIKSLHNMKWVKATGLPDSIKSKIIEENAHPGFLNNQLFPYEVGGVTKTAYGTFNYSEILVSIPINRCGTYQEFANHAIHSWNKSDSHAGIMNANYKNKVIVGTTTFYCKKTQRVIISFVYII